MVKQKSRYLLIEMKWIGKPPNVDSGDLAKHIRRSMTNNFGDWKGGAYNTGSFHLFPYQLSNCFFRLCSYLFQPTNENCDCEGAARRISLRMGGNYPHKFDFGC